MIDDMHAFYIGILDIIEKNMNTFQRYIGKQFLYIRTDENGKELRSPGEAAFIHVLKLYHVPCSLKTKKNDHYAFYMIDFRLREVGWKSAMFQEDDKGECHFFFGIRFQTDLLDEPCVQIKKLVIHKNNKSLDIRKIREATGGGEEFQCDDVELSEQNFKEADGWRYVNGWVEVGWPDEDQRIPDSYDNETCVRSEKETGVYCDMERKMCAADQFLDELSMEFRLEVNYILRLKQFLNYSIQTEMARDFCRVNADYKCQMPYLNLLLHVGEKEQGMAFAAKLSAFLRNNRERKVMISQRDEIERLIVAIKNNHLPEMPSLDELEKDSCVIIYDCILKPMVDQDAPTGGDIADGKRRMKAYELFWELVANACKENGDKLFFVLADDECYRDLAYNCTEIYYRVFNTHITIPDYSVEELYERSLSDLKEKGFAFGEGFEEALDRYYQAVYNKAELKGMAFVTDLENRICVNYYRKKQDVHLMDRIVTEEYIPRYRESISNPGMVWDELDAMTGLKNVKKELQAVYNGMAAGLELKAKSGYHMFFVGNPGTGKTTVARMVSKLLNSMGVIKTDRLVEAKPGDLVSKWRGNTTEKALETIREAYNGVLFIDEAYGFKNDDDKYQTAMEVLIKEMEDHADKLVVIFAGYEEDMNELKKVNAGLESRLRAVIHFEDYSNEELKTILKGFLKKDGFELTKDAEERVEALIAAKRAERFFGNARVMRNIAANLAEAWAAEFVSARDRGQVLAHVIDVSCVEKLMPDKEGDGIDGLIGLADLKEKLNDFKNSVAYRHFLKERGVDIPASNMHMIFEGNPGTGKTTVAKMLARDLYGIGVLNTDKCLIVEKKDLANYSKNMTPAQHAEECVKKAIGGILFVDEAYSLAGNAGREIIEVFLTAMEEHKENTIFVFAGYTDAMREFLEMNDGLTSRISYVFHFEDYKVDELLSIFYKKMGKSGLSVADEAEEKIKEVLEYFQAVPNFGNGRFVDQLIGQIISKRAGREYNDREYNDIRVQDIPEIGEMIKTFSRRGEAHDPSKITDAQRKRTAVHELGHALVVLQKDRETVPESISIKSEFGSYGRVLINPGTGNKTESEYLNLVATLLSGRNAEILFFGEHSGGCSSDFKEAKRLCKVMTEQLAMGTIGKTTPKDMLIKADELSKSILKENKEFIEKMADILVEKRVISGEELRKEYENYRGQKSEGGCGHEGEN